MGLSNLFSSLLSGTLPGFGSITRTKLAASTGAVTQFASFLTGVFTLAVSFGLLGLLRDLPKCILAVVVGVVVFSILEEAPADIKVGLPRVSFPCSLGVDPDRLANSSIGA